MGGPLNIPEIFNGGSKWFFFFGWNVSVTSFFFQSSHAGRTQRRFFQCELQRRQRQCNSCINGQQYQFNGVLNQIDPTLFSPASKDLLQYIPFPNIPANRMGQNFHYITSDNSSSDAVIFRLIHNLGSASGAPIGPLGGGGGGRGGGGRRHRNNINFGLNWTRTNTTLVNSFPSLAGGTGTQGLNASAGWTYGKNRTINILRFNYNHYHISTHGPQAEPASPAFPMIHLIGDFRNRALPRSETLATRPRGARWIKPTRFPTPFPEPCETQFPVWRRRATAACCRAFVLRETPRCLSSSRDLLLLEYPLAVLVRIPDMTSRI